MSSKQLVRQAKGFLDISPQDGGTSAVNGGGVDRQGYDNATLYALVGAITGTIDWKLQHDDDDGAGSPAGTWADITGAAGDQYAATDDNKLALGAVDLKNVKRHVRMVITPTGGSTNLIAGLIVLSNRHDSLLDADHGATPAGLRFNI